MIGNPLPWGGSGFTILEEGDLDPASWQLRVRRYLVCTPDGQALPDVFATLEEAKAEVERREAGA